MLKAVHIKKVYMILYTPLNSFPHLDLNSDLHRVVCPPSVQHPHSLSTAVSFTPEKQRNEFITTDDFDLNSDSDWL